jgi:predicted metalloprotease with PDZ domain
MKYLLVALTLGAGVLEAQEAPPQKLMLGIRYNEGQKDKRLAITYVDPGGLAKQIGLQVGDVFATINGVKIDTTADLDKTLAAVLGSVSTSSSSSAVYQIKVNRDKTLESLEGEIRKSEKTGAYYVVPKKR